MNCEHCGKTFRFIPKKRMRFCSRSCYEQRTRGQNSPNAILTDAQVAQIRTASAAGEAGAQIARRFGVSSSLVCLLKKNKRRAA